MVCVYCRGATQVTNSRLQRKSNSIWRRRRCLACGAIFSSEERSIYERSLVVKHGTSHIVPFDRDLLFLSVYDACRHRKTAVNDATALTVTILGKLLAEYASTGAVQRDNIVATTRAVLERFDKAAQVHYSAFHPL